MAIDRSAWLVVDAFEAKLAEYCGAPFAITTDSCTNALYLCFQRLMRRMDLLEPEGLELPRFTYVGVPRAAMNAGFMVDFIDQPWVGEYQINGTPIVDAARWLRRGMHVTGRWACLSFQASKHLPIGRGGAILCDNEEDARWFRRARLDGRDQNRNIMNQTEFQWGFHCYLTPDAAARGLWLMSALKDHNEPLPGLYPDLSLVRFA